VLNEEMKWKNYEINFLNAHNLGKNVDGGLSNNNNMNKSLKLKLLHWMIS